MSMMFWKYFLFLTSLVMIGISKDSPICQRLGIITYLFNLIIQLWNSLKHRSTITLILTINCHWANILIMKKVRQQKKKDFLISCNLLWNAVAYWSFSNLLKDLILIMKMLFMTNYKHRLHIKLNHSNSMWHYEQKDSLKSTHTKNWFKLRLYQKDFAIKYLSYIFTTNEIFSQTSKHSYCIFLYNWILQKFFFHL